MTVDIVCAVLNGARFLPDFFKGLNEQTHTDWRLWVRDDGSVDATVPLLRAAEAADPRVHVVHTGGPKSGATGAFAWLLARIPADAAYVMMADADDVWLPRKIEATLAALRAAEAVHGRGTPLLAHSDLVVVDEALRMVHPSFWTFARIAPEPATVRRIAVRNVVTGPAIVMNRALCDRINPMPPEAVYHDGWCALVAAALGAVVAVPEPLVLYRQHGANSVGASQSKALVGWRERARAVVRGAANASTFRHNLGRTARQARVLVDRYGAELRPADRRFLEAYARIPDRPLLRRKIDLARYHASAERGWLKSIGDVVRG